MSTSKFNFKSIFKRRIIDSPGHKGSLLVHVLIESNYFGRGRVGLFHLPYYVKDIRHLTDYDFVLLHRKLLGTYWAQRRCENTKYLEIQYTIPADLWHLHRTYLRVRIVEDDSTVEVIYDVTGDCLKNLKIV